MKSVEDIEKDLDNIIIALEKVTKFYKRVSPTYIHIHPEEAECMRKYYNFTQWKYDDYIWYTSIGKHKIPVMNDIEKFCNKKDRVRLYSRWVNVERTIKELREALLK